MTSMISSTYYSYSQAVFREEYSQDSGPAECAFVFVSLTVDKSAVSLVAWPSLVYPLFLCNGR